MADTTQPLLTHTHFLLRRLHSLCGIVPLGVFLINHLLANSTAFLGEQHFNHHIDLIHGLPWLLAIEVLFIFVPLAFHGIYGVAIAWQGRLNQHQYPYMDNWRYTLQRITAYIMVVFVVLHLAHYRFAHWLGGEAFSSGPDYPGGYFGFTIDNFPHFLPVWIWMVIYAIGLSAAVFHFCNGIVTFCITWGIIIGDGSRRKVSLVAGGLGVVLLVWGVLSLYALGTMKVSEHDSPPDSTPIAQHVMK